MKNNVLSNDFTNDSWPASRIQASNETKLCSSASATATQRRAGSGEAKSDELVRDRFVTLSSWPLIGAEQDERCMSA